MRLTDKDNKIEGQDTQTNQFLSVYIWPQSFQTYHLKVSALWSRLSILLPLFVNRIYKFIYHYNGRQHELGTDAPASPKKCQASTERVATVHVAMTPRENKEYTRVVEKQKKNSSCFVFIAVIVVTISD